MRPLMLTMAAVLVLSACSDDSGDGDIGGSGGSGGTAGGPGGVVGTAGGGAGGAATVSALADVVGVAFGKGGSFNYQVSITIAAEETGCDQYVDWWEIVSLDGELIHREVFDSPQAVDGVVSSVLDPAPIESNVVYVYRAHMVPGGYGGDVRVSAQTGGAFDDGRDYTLAFPELESASPQPPACMED